jgi:hypothetical protein
MINPMKSELCVIYDPGGINVMNNFASDGENKNSSTEEVLLGTALRDRLDIISRRIPPYVALLDEIIVRRVYDPGGMD